MGTPRNRLTGLGLALALIASACGNDGETDRTPDAGPVTSTTTTAPADSRDDPAPTVTADEGVDATADLIIHNAVVVTVDPDSTIAEAVAVADGKIIAVGPSADLMALADDDTVVADADGRTVLPGFVEPHTHLMQVAAPDTAAMLNAERELIESGITTAGEPSVGPAELEAFLALDAAGELTLRSHVYVLYNSVCGERDLGDFYLSNAFNRDPEARLALAGVKIFTDGGVCGGPAMSVDYLDSTPEDLYNSGWVGDGDLYVTAGEVAGVLGEVDAAGGQTVIHAIGDRAIATAIEGVRAAGPLDNPHQIHHLSFASMLGPDHLAAFDELGLIPVAQMMPWARACEEGRTALWRSIMAPAALDVIEDRVGINAANPDVRWAWHGDAPSIIGTPLQQMFSIVSGGSTDGAVICYPEVWADFATITAEEALRWTTINAAAAMGFEDDFGSIEVGKAGDLIVLENDPFDADLELAFAHNRPLATIIAGTVAACDGDLCEALTGEITPSPPTPGELTPLPSADCHVNTVAPIGWWAAEGDTSDVVGGPAGNAIDSVVYGPGAVGEGFLLDGGTIALAEPGPLISPDGPFTIETWVAVAEGAHFDDFQSIFNIGPVFVRKDEVAEGNRISVFVELDDGSVEPRVQAPSPVVADTWTHVAATWDGEDLALFIDGAAVGTTPRAGRLAPNFVVPQIGRGELTSTDGPTFHGRIDEFSIYDLVLSAEAIASIHAAGSAGKCRPGSG